jgi:NADH-quinone oxidoreductase subunit A
MVPAAEAGARAALSELLVTGASLTVARFPALLVQVLCFLVVSERTIQEGVSAVLDSWLPFLIYALFAAAIPASMLVMSFVFSTRPKARARARGIPFESGVSQGPPPEQRFTISFYLTAMLFIVFDIEIVFLYPLAVILDQLAWFGVAELLVFIGILALGYVYIWRKGALEWQ